MGAVATPAGPPASALDRVMRDAAMAASEACFSAERGANAGGDEGAAGAIVASAIDLAMWPRGRLRVSRNSS